MLDTMTIFIMVLMLPLPILLNRWRGTGAIITIGKFRLIGNIIYALYIASIIGCATALTDNMLPFISIIINGEDTVYIFENNQFFSSFIFAFLGAGLYIAGESFAWGKWVGYLVSENGEVEYDNKTGRSFPYIHYIANGIVDQEMNYRLYCQVALAIRGLVWWLPVLAVLGVAGVFPWWLVLVNGAVAGIGFPIACEIGKRWQYTLQSKWLCMSPGWENQEVVYGVIHFLVFTLSIVLCKAFL